MGLCSSLPQWNENWKEVKDVCRRLDIQKSEAKSLYRAFLKADQAEAGTIVLSDLLAIAGIEESRAGFARRVFGAMDSNSDGDLDFAEMIVAIWNLCSLSDEKLMDFVFFLYDIDQNESINRRELKHAVHEVLSASDASRMMTSLNRLHPGKVLDSEDFRTFLRRNPAVLFPAFALRNELRDGVCGGRYWERISRRRERMPARLAHWRGVYQLLRERSSSRRTSLQRASTAGSGGAGRADSGAAGAANERESSQQEEEFKKAIAELDKEPTQNPRVKQRRNTLYFMREMQETGESWSLAKARRKKEEEQQRVAQQQQKQRRGSFFDNSLRNVRELTQRHREKKKRKQKRGKGGGTARAARARAQQARGEGPPSRSPPGGVTYTLETVPEHLRDPTAHRRTRETAVTPPSESDGSSGRAGRGATPPSGDRPVYVKKRVKRSEAENGKYVASVPEGAIVRSGEANAPAAARSPAVSGPPSAAASR